MKCSWSRIDLEFKSQQLNPTPNIHFTQYFQKGSPPKSYIKVLVIGQAGTPFENGCFHMTLDLDNFPFKMPRLTIETEMFHASLKKGLRCLCYLQDKWAPTKKIIKNFSQILTQQMISPRLTGRYVVDHNGLLEAYNLCLNNEQEYNKKAREYTEKYAGLQNNPPKN